MSTLRLTTISNQSGSSSVPSDTVINGSAKAWVNFNGTGVVAIRASFNVSSITDNGTGDYTVNFTVAMVDANYSISGMVQDADTSIDTCVVGIQNPGGLTSSTARLRTTYGAGTSYDFTIVCASIFR